MFESTADLQLRRANQRLRERGLDRVSVDRDQSQREWPLRALYRFERPLDLGMLVRPTELRPRLELTRLGRSWSKEAHHRELYGEYVFFADEGERLRRLLTPALTRYIVARYRAGENPALDDEGCEVVLPGLATSYDERTIADLVGSLEALVGHVERALPEVPVATPLGPLAQGLSRLPERGMISHTPLVYSGVRAGRELQVRARRVRHLRYDVTLRVGFEGALRAGLSLRPRTTWHGLGGIFGAKVPRTGDAAFDHAFYATVGSGAGISMAELLPAGARELLGALAERAGEVHADDQGLQVALRGGALKDLDATLATQIDTLEEAAATIERARWGRAEAGPYR